MVEHVAFEGHGLPVMSLEECLVDRLCGAKHWDDATDRERVVALLVAQGDRMDWDLVECRAREENGLDELEQLRALLD